MFGTIGGPELILILVIALIVFGPRKLPEIGKSVGKMVVEFRKATSDFQRTLEQEVEAEKHPLPAPATPATAVAVEAVPVPAAEAVPHTTAPATTPSETTSKA